MTASVLSAIQAGLLSLKPGERRVAEVILEKPEWAIEATLQEVADEAGVSTATVVRTAQHLGYRGFPHLRVLIARDLGIAEERPPTDSNGPADVVRSYFATVAAGIEQMAALLDSTALEAAVDLLTTAPRILIAGNGVSSPVAADLAMRLAAIGRPAEAPPDNLDQQIRAGLLGSDDLCVLVSGTGATRNSLEVARAARAAGARLVSLTSFTSSPLSELVDVELVVALGSRGLREELRSTMRIPHLILANALVAAVASRLEDAAETRAKVLGVVAGEMDDPD